MSDTLMYFSNVKKEPKKNKANEDNSALPSKEEFVKRLEAMLLSEEEMKEQGYPCAAEGAIDAANILKPALSRGELQCIGATTLEEYRKHIEKDAALERRFQPVMVGEPSVDETIEILYGLRDRYEKHHKLVISDEALTAAAKFAEANFAKE